ncbi:hypothetical protein GCM10010256_21500 [Streptomyces coeruleorubidus]|nr:hypothetical protein GCM10010256_21500 [Streptomyces coeruleorubidus]
MILEAFCRRWVKGMKSQPPLAHRAAQPVAALLCTPLKVARLITDSKGAECQAYPDRAQAGS